MTGAQHTAAGGRPGYRIRGIQPTSERFLAQNIRPKIGSDKGIKESIPSVNHPQICSLNGRKWPLI